MLSRLSRCRRGGVVEGLIPLARSALADAARGEAAASQSGRGGESAVDSVVAGDRSSTTSTLTAASSLSARPFHSRSSSSGSSAEERRDAKQQLVIHSSRGLLPFSSSFSSRHSPLLPPLLRRKNPTSSSSSSSSSYSTAAPSPRKLDDIMKLDSLRDKTGEEIASIWTEFHRDDSKNRVGGTLSAAAYRSFTEHIAEAPMLVWPLRKEVAAGSSSGSGRSGGGEAAEEEKENGGGGGLVVLLSQAQLPHVLFTTVDEFRALGPDAPAHVVLTHYAELAEEKGVVLWRADVVSPALLVSAAPASSAASSSSSAAADGGEGGEAAGEAKAPPPSSSSSSSSSDAARALVATTHALYADPEGRAHARAFNEAKGFDFGALMRYFGLTP